MSLLGKPAPTPQHYAPEVLYPIARAEGRRALGLDQGALPFGGEDIWHAWELSWLAPGAGPQCAVARFRVPCDSPMLVESKSLKLYLNSLNQTEFESRDALLATLEKDLGDACGAPVAVDILALDDAELGLSELPGESVDDWPLPSLAAAPDAALLRPAVSGDGQVLHSHALRSLCPVTAQPDWASVVLWLEGAALEPASLLAYLVSFRRHQDFHEQCVERMFRDIQQVLAPRSLSLLALYTRRGGLDINPWRSSGGGSPPRLRSARQ